MYVIADLTSTQCIQQVRRPIQILAAENECVKHVIDADSKNQRSRSSHVQVACCVLMYCLQCDGESPCNRCQADNAICVFGERKKVQDKVYPKGQAFSKYINDAKLTQTL